MWLVVSFELPQTEEWLGAEGVTWCYNYYFFKTTLWFWNHTKTQIQKQKVEVQKLQIQIHCVSGGQRRTLVGLSRGRRQRRLFASPDLHSLFCRLLSSQLLYFRAQIRKYRYTACNKIWPLSKLENCIILYKSRARPLEVGTSLSWRYRCCCFGADVVVDVGVVIYIHV